MDDFQVYLNHMESLSHQMNDGLSFLLVLRGQVMFTTFGEASILDSNSLAVINHRELYSVESRGQNMVLLLRVSGEYLSTRCPEILKNRYTCSSVKAQSGTESLYESLKQSVARMAFVYLKQGEEDRLLFQSELMVVLHTLLHHFISGETYEMGEVTRDGKLYPVLSYINQNYRSPITLEQLAARAYLSVPYLSKLFRKETGVSYLEYLTNIRLKAAVHDLIYTKEPVTRIAMNSGFSGIKTFNSQFRKKYGCSPGEYRKKYALISEKERSGGNNSTVRSPESLEALVRYVSRFEPEADMGEPKRCVLNIRQAGRLQVDFPRKILDIGHILSALQSTVQMQIREAQKAIGFEYAMFDGLFFETEHVPDRELIHYFQCTEIIKNLEQMGLVPFIRVSLTQPAREEKERQQYLLRRMKRQLETVCGRFEEEYLEQWHFELCAPESELSFVLEAASVIKQVCSKFRTGILVGEHPYPAKKMDFVMHNQFLLLVDFLSFTSDPNQALAPAEETKYREFHRSYHHRKLEAVKAWMEETGARLPVYLTHFNTLTGKSQVEAGEFHRTALIADMVFSLAQTTAGMAFALNLSSRDNPVPALLSYPLSLFLYNNIRRPLFFTLRSLMLLKEQVLMFDSHILVTMDKKGTLAVLMYHPCYTDPFQSLDHVRGTGNIRNVDLILQNMPAGRYRIKSIRLDRDNGSLYNNWLKMNFSNPLEEDDIVEYLENFCNPSISLMEESIDGRYEIHQSLTLNAIAVFLIRREAD